MGNTYTDFKGFFRNKGLRVTPQRLAIASIVTDGKAHLSADEVYQKAKKRLPIISRATVYNTLNSLVEYGVVRELHFSEGGVLYDNNLDKHHHFVCEDTGEVLDVPREVVSQFRWKGLESKYDVKGYTIVFHGRRKRKES